MWRDSSNVLFVLEEEAKELNVPQKSHLKNHNQKDYNHMDPSDYIVV